MTQPRRIAVYARVSTTRQAEADLSIPDQLRQARAWCDRQGHELVHEFVEPGASGTDENRPVFQQMLAEAKRRPRPFDAILVHSFSRLCRDQFVYAVTKRTLQRAGIELISMTQPLGNEATGEMMESILVAFDAYQSRENSKHTSRAMKENARQGFWNGSRPPFGYRTVEAEHRGAKVKKAIAVDETEAAVVRRVYALYLGSAGRRLGIKAIATRLNAERVRYRGKPFSISNVHRMLTAETYVGRYWFNRTCARTGVGRPRDEWVPLEVPPILDATDFERVQARLAEHNPRRTPARVVSGPTLLTGLAKCACCGGGMTLRTGKNGKYRYYTCALRAQKAVDSCPAQAMPMEPTDRIVLDALAERVFHPERLAALLADHLDRQRETEGARRERASRLKAEMTEVEGSLRRLGEAIERGLLDLDDPSLKDRLSTLRARRLALREELDDRSRPETAKPALTPERIACLGEAIRAHLIDGPPDLRRAYLRLFVDRVVLGPDEIRISGPTAVLAKAAETAPATEPGEVLTSVREWRPRRDSNARPPD